MAANTTRSTVIRLTTQSLADQSTLSRVRFKGVFGETGQGAMPHNGGMATNNGRQYCA